MKTLVKHRAKKRRVQAPARDWAVLLAVAAEIVNSYDTSVTLRQLFYRLVALGPVEGLPNTQNAYKSLSHHSAIARRAGTFPDLIDRGRSIYRYQFWKGIADRLDDAVETHRLDRTIGQKYLIFIGIEKSGIVEQAMAWFGERGFPVIPTGGFDSQSHVDDVKRLVAADGRPAVLLTAGDFDGSGECIIRDFIDRTDCWGERPKKKPAPRPMNTGPGVTSASSWSGLPSRVRQVALTEKQVLVDYPHLSRGDGKEDDSRKNRFLADHPNLHGKYIQVELDALEPEVLHQLYEDAIAEFWDKSAYEAILVREENQRRRFQAFAKKWKE